MFEGAVAAFLNRLLGRYVEDLDAEQFNVGIFSGDTYLTDLKLKPEALYQLGLPIRVEIGLIGQIVLKIPWANLLSQPIVLCIEDIYVVAVPAMSKPYNMDVQKRLIRAEKKKILDDIEDDNLLKSGMSSELFDSLITSIIKNFQITINNVHIRYEERLPSGCLCACGICIQSISMTTTNNKWKPGVNAPNSQTVYQLVRAESFSIYMDNDTESSVPSHPSTWDFSTFLTWKSSMYNSLQTFGMNNKEFQFLLKPFTAKIKIIIYKGNQTQPSRMLVDIVLQDIAMQVSEKQYITFCCLYDSLQHAIINRPHRKYKPDQSVKEDAVAWWKYAYNSVLEYNIKPYTWTNILEHRRNYKKYKETYMQSMMRPNDTELKLDLQKYEDNLTILNIVIARQHARHELKNRNLENEYRNLNSNLSNPKKNKDSAVNCQKIEDEIDQQNGQESKKIQYHLVENGPGLKINLEKLPKPIDYKYNFTLANCSLSLLNKDKEIFVITITQFLTSVEVRPGLSAFKISTRAESFVIEGISSEGDLVPLVIVDNVLTGNVASNFLAIDFEKNPANLDSNFDVSLKLEAIEVIYHSYAMREIISFFNFDNAYVRNAALYAHSFGLIAGAKFAALVDDIVSQTLRISLKIDVKGPYIVFPEHGSMQKGGHLLIVDFGNMTLTNELQAVNLQLEDATLMELEELLYDRLCIVFSGAQILFCHSGDDWRTVRKRKDSEYHFVPKIQANLTVSYSIKPEYHQLPRVKLNISISSMKLNLTESKLQLIMHYLNLLLLLYHNDVKKYKGYLEKSNKEVKCTTFVPSIKELMALRQNIILLSGTVKQNKFKHVTDDLLKNNVPKLDRSVVSSEVSEEDLELLSKTIHLSGFDDSISPCNHINLLLRFAIGEISLHFGHLVDGREQAYLNLRLHTLYLESAIMGYGVAVQFGLGSVLLVDKTSAGVTGSYLELISTDDSDEVLAISYRKIRSNCPDFKSHFKNIERLLVVNILNVNITLHRSALLKLQDQWNNLNGIYNGTSILDFVEKVNNVVAQWKGTVVDPPIPPGAIKLHYSARLSKLVLRMCDKDADLMEMKISGLENDCIYNANERMVLRAHLRNLLIEDLNNDTLYSKILTTEEDKVFDFKYVRHTPRMYVNSDIDTNQDDVMSDGTFKLSVGRINCVFHSKILRDCQYFVSPFAYIFKNGHVKSLGSKFVTGVREFKTSATKLRVFVDIQGPTFLLPQQKDVPTLLVLDVGVLSVENFFKKIDQASQFSKMSANDSNHSIIDNILVKWEGMTLSRAIMTLSRDLEVQESIIEQIHVHFDIKRKTEYRSMLEFEMYGLSNVQGSVDSVCINLSQRDFKSIVSVWRDNLFRTLRMKKCDTEKRIAKIAQLEKASMDEARLKKLEMFLAQNEATLCEINIKLTLEGLQLNLFLDMEEVLSSPVRDMNHGVCKLSFGEVVSTFDFYSDKSLKTKLSLQTCVLEDTRRSSAVVKKIIQSPAKQLGMNLESCISVSMSPVVDVTYNQSPSGDKCFDILIQETRVNLSVPFMIQLGRYFVDALPADHTERGEVNLAYQPEFNGYAISGATIGANKLGIRAQDYKEQPATSVSIRIQKPEILLFGDLKASNAHVILLQAELTIEYSRHNNSSSIACTLSNVRAKSRRQRNYLSQCPYWLLYPCDVEICVKEDFLESRTQADVTVNSIDVHLSIGVIHTLMDILIETSNFIKTITIKPENKSTGHEFNVNVDLWTSKKVSNIPFKEIEERHTGLEVEDENQILILELKPMSVNLFLEMECTVEQLPFVKVESLIAASLTDSYNKFCLESSVSLQAYCYNFDYRSWEPLIELCTKDDHVYKPWEVNIKMCTGKAYLINSNWNDPCQLERESLPKKKKRDKEPLDQDSMDMLFIGPEETTAAKISEPELYSECEDDTDSDDAQSPRKFARTFTYLFSNIGSSGDEDSESDDSTADEDEGLELTPEYNVESFSPELRASTKTNSTAMYIIVSAENKINLTITPNTISIVDTILDTFSQVKSDIPIVPISTGKLSLQNAIGCASRIELLAQDDINGKIVRRVIAVQDFQDVSPLASPPSSPDIQTRSSKSPRWIENENGFDDPDVAESNVLSSADIFYDKSPVHIYKTITEELLHIVLEGFDDTLLYCPQKKSHTLFPLRPARHGVRYHLVIETIIDKYLHRTVSVRSPLQIRNETSYALGLYYKKQAAETLSLPHIGEVTNPFDDNIRMAIVEPDCTYNVPLYVAYHLPIHILPAYLEKYQVSKEGIYWKALSDSINATKDVYCDPKEGEKHSSVFGIKALYAENVLKRQIGCQVPSCLISIVPPVVFSNQLPFVVDVNVACIDYEVKIEPGEKINMHHLRCESDAQVVFKIQHYIGAHWTGTVKLNSNMERKFISMSGDNESDLTKPFVLCIELDKTRNLNFIIQAQYWMVNRSGLPLFIQECHSHATYEMPEEEMMMFSHKSLKKCLVRLRAHQSEWSLPFRLDGISSMSLIVCKDAERRRKYRILTEIKNSHLSPHFTRIVTFLPYFLINNKTKRTLRFMEENVEADLWNDLLPGQDVPFWPCTESMKMRVKWKNSQLVSQHFDIVQTGKTVLRMDNGSALCVEIEGGKTSPYYITFHRYVPGDAPIRIDNFCDDLFLKINQINSGQVTLINPFQSLLYTWDDPTKARELIWNVYNNKKAGYLAKFKTDGYGHESVSFVTVERYESCPASFAKPTEQEKPIQRSQTEVDNSSSSSSESDVEIESKPAKLGQIRKDRTVVYWVSYMEGEQRVLLFTQYEGVFHKVKTVIDPEPSKAEIFLSIAGIGLSVIVKSEDTVKELIHVNITDSAAHWELCVGKRWKSLTLELSAWIESKYTSSYKRAQLDNFINVDLTKMHMTKPFFGKLRRTYSPGIWMHCRKSVTFTYVQGCIHRIQVDNQLRDAAFPVVLNSSSQKNLTNVAGHRKLKHCVEFICLKQRKNKYSIYKGISLVFRELNIHLQEDFLFHLINGLIPKKTETKHSIAAKLRKDVSNIHATASSSKSQVTGVKRKIIIEHLYISPMVVRLTLQTNMESSNARNYYQLSRYRSVVRYIFEYAEKGASEKHAEFRLSHYLNDSVVTDGEKLLLNVSRSYMAQITQQFYVLIRSATVLGNPYGYNFKSPGDHFYDPDSILLCGDELAEKLSHDAALHLGHATADNVHTTMFNIENDLHIFHTKAKTINFENTDLPLAILSAENSFSAEVELEMSGLVTTSTDNIHQEELKYFLKTLGKRISILANKENFSLTLFTEIIADTIKRAQERGHRLVSRVRLPRYINPYVGAEVFSTHKAKGLHLLHVISKDHSTRGDCYWAHAALSNDGKYIALVSLQRIYFIEKGRAWGSWSVKWSLETNQLLSPPTIVDNRLILQVNKTEQASSPIVDWYLECKETNVLEWLCRKINTAMILNMESSICSKEDV